MAFKEQIGIYQQGAKTTIVIYNMKESTKKKIADLILQDIKAESPEEEVLIPPITQVTDLKPFIPELTASEMDIDNMSSILVEQAIENYGQVPQRLLEILLQIRQNGNDTDVAAANKKICSTLQKASEAATLPFKQGILFNYANLPEFYDVITKMIRQKGCGMDLEFGTQEYMDAVKNMIGMCREEELSGALEAIGTRFLSGHN